MILSKRTIDILKNCSDINQSILIKKGSKIKTISPLKNILFEAYIDEVFPCDFAIYDLPTFLRVANHSMKDANIDFEEDKLIFRKGIKEHKYYYCKPELVVSPPERVLDMPDECSSIYLMQDVFEDLLRGANIAKLHDLVIFGCQESNSIYAEMTNLDNETSGGVRIKIANKLEPDNWFLEGPERRVVIKKGTLTIMPFDYEVKFSNGISEFQAIGDSHKYWFALESTSNFY